MRRLYFRIYLAVLGSLALFAILAGLAGWLFREFHEPDAGFGGGGQFISEIADHLFPKNADAGALEHELEFWHKKSGFSLALVSPDGNVLAQAGAIPNEDLQRLSKHSSHSLRWGGWRGAFSATLADGRRLAAIRPPPEAGSLRHWRWLGIVIAIGLAVAVCAYPVIRNLTKNLERLERGVAAFGQGDFSSRVEASGRDEVAKLAETFNAAADRIEVLIKTQKTLLANASHELRSPLARLRMATEAAAPAVPIEARREINRNIAELDSLVGEILLSSRLDTADAIGDELETIDLAGLLAEECAPFRADLAVSPEEALLVTGDPRLLRRVFRNLLENARRYGGSQAPEISAKREGDAAIVNFCDRGPGIPESERDRVFQPFYRLKGSSESGTGLGLALVRQIVLRHGGSVSCLPRDGAGACFRVRLPLVAASSSLGLNR